MKTILIIAETDGNSPKPVTFELSSLGRRMDGQAGENVLVLVVGVSPDEAAQTIAAETGLDVFRRLLELADRLGDQRLVFKDQQVGIKDGRLLRSQILRDFALDLLHLLARHHQGLLETGDLLDPFFCADIVVRHLHVALDVDKHLPIGDAF